ncbi:O-acetyl-ADP-ribose deacetylase [Salinicola endophyticus]|uniref:O-acetyl-ADP-ribose deacetylase n=1 Tax=Salinicola endophyticus TaxID=1949083 RepID=A0ABY8FGZ2_9GAMM|nr:MULTISPECIES: O-acetyl-ADP-ribose deacetylase [Salinicola]WFF41802.1 O-acetyl-ADP-ribose deacetylase [Salinicola endophyticus]
MQIHHRQGRLSVAEGDITRFDGDAIVNAANRSLLGGGGVDGAIHRAAGPQLLEACRELRRTIWPDGLPVGQVALTPGFRLPAEYVVHTVGPVYAESEEPRGQLAACYRNALALAADQGFTRLAFPAISTGVYGYPSAEAARVVADVMRERLPQLPALEVTLMFFSAADAETFVQAAS